MVILEKHVSRLLNFDTTNMVLFVPNTFSTYFNFFFLIIMAYKQYYINYGICLSERPILNILIRIDHIIIFSTIRLYLKSQCCFSKKKITMFVNSLIVMSIFLTFANVSLVFLQHFVAPSTWINSVILTSAILITLLWT